jgi:hypothetical protein
MEETRKQKKRTKFDMLDIYAKVYERFHGKAALEDKTASESIVALFNDNDDIFAIPTPKELKVKIEDSGQKDDAQDLFSELWKILGKYWVEIVIDDMQVHPLQDDMQRYSLTLTKENLIKLYNHMPLKLRAAIDKYNMIEYFTDCEISGEDLLFIEEDCNLPLPESGDDDIVEETNEEKKKQ